MDPNLALFLESEVAIYSEMDMLWSFKIFFLPESFISKTVACLWIRYQS